MAMAGWVRHMSSEEPPPPIVEVPPEPPPTPAADERPPEPGEEWIEEYESDKKQRRPRRKARHLVGTVVAVAIVLTLVVWTLLSPQVLPVVGETYLDSTEYASLGSYSGRLDIWWLMDLVHVADTEWGVSVSGEQNVSSGQHVTFRVLITKISEEMKNPWFVGTSVDLKRVEMYLEDGTMIGSTASESSEPFGPVAYIDAVFADQGYNECYVYVEMTVYCKMIVGFLPVKVLRMQVDLDADILVS